MTFNVKDINSKPEMTGKALLAASAAVLWGISAPVFADSRQDNDSDSVDLTDSRISGDFDYGVCRGTNPNCYHDWVGAGRQNKVLVYTRTAGPRHANLGPALPAGLNPPLDPARHIVQTNLIRSEEHTSELQSLRHLVCRLLLEKKNGFNRTLDAINNVFRKFSAFHDETGRLNVDGMNIIFNDYSNNRNLHSFPTRRSSDLHANLGPALPAGLNPPLDPARHIVQTNLI